MGEQLFARADASAARACTQPECDLVGTERLFAPQRPNGFNGRPPLGVNATEPSDRPRVGCKHSFNGHPPLGVNATFAVLAACLKNNRVSMGTHPWG